MSLDHRRKPTSSLLDSPTPSMYLAVWTMATLSGTLAAWVATVVDTTWLNMPVSVWVFLVVWASVTASLSYRRVPSGVAARGLAVSSGLLLLVPFAVFGPRILTALESGRFVGERAFSGGFYGLLSWGMLAGVGAMAVLAVSRRLSARAERLRRRRVTHELREYE
jgi:hypothetical protein